MPLPTKEEARLCAIVVKEISHALGLKGSPAATGRLTALVARLFNRGNRDYTSLHEAVIRSEELAVITSASDNAGASSWPPAVDDTLNARQD